MKLLILTQAIDRNDPALGFFHRWVEEFASHCEKVIVICLRKGEYAIPPNVEVISLGKERGVPRLARAWKFLELVVSRRKDYDRVLVHMNPEYIVLGGALWRVMKKPIALWYVHKSVNVRLRIATALADVVFTASKESFRLPTKKLRVVGHGIDTEFFSPSSSVQRSEAVLSVGRLMRSKRHDLAIRAAALARRDLRIAGEGPERQALEKLAQEVGAHATFLGALTQEKLRDEYRRAAFLIHTSETGSLDKVVLEALATDVAVITTSDVYKEVPVQTVAATPEAIAEALKRPRESVDRVSIIRQKHSLKELIPRILEEWRTGYSS